MQKTPFFVDAKECAKLSAFIENYWMKRGAEALDTKETKLGRVGDDKWGYGLVNDVHTLHMSVLAKLRRRRASLEKFRVEYDKLCKSYRVYTRNNSFTSREYEGPGGGSKHASERGDFADAITLCALANRRGSLAMFKRGTQVVYWKLKPEKLRDDLLAYTEKFKELLDTVTVDK